MERPPHGVPSQVIEGLQNLSGGLSGTPDGPESPGQQAVRGVGAEPTSREQRFDDKEALSPGKRDAVALSNPE